MRVLLGREVGNDPRRRRGVAESGQRDVHFGPLPLRAALTHAQNAMLLAMA